MSKDDRTNEFVRGCVRLADRFSNMEPVRHDAAALMVSVARRAIESPQETAPIGHYVKDLRLAIIDAYGEPWDLADLSRIKQEDAVAAWMWFQDSTGAVLDKATSATTLIDAVTEMRARGPGWRKRMADALERDFHRHPY